MNDASLVTEYASGGGGGGGGAMTNNTGNGSLSNAGGVSGASQGVSGVASGAGVAGVVSGAAGNGVSVVTRSAEEHALYLEDVRRARRRMNAPVVDLRALRKTTREDATTGSFGTVFNNARTLINDEVSLLLENLATHSIHGVARGGVGKEIFNKSREYVMRFQRFKSKEAAEAVKARLTSQGMTSFEVGCFCNLVPESAEEAKAIIPTLARFENEELSALIEDVYQYRSHA